MEEKILEVLVNGKSIGEVKMELDGHTTKVNGGPIMLTGEYSMSPEEIETMVHKRVERKYLGQEIEIRSY